MPLKKGCTKKVRDANIEEMIKAGHPPKQATAAAWREYRKSCARKAAASRKAKRGNKTR